MNYLRTIILTFLLIYLYIYIVNKQDSHLNYKLESLNHEIDEVLIRSQKNNDEKLYNAIECLTRSDNNFKKSYQNYKNLHFLRKLINHSIKNLNIDSTRLDSIFRLIKFERGGADNLMHLYEAAMQLEVKPSSNPVGIIQELKLKQFIMNQSFFLGHCIDKSIIDDINPVMFISPALFGINNQLELDISDKKKGESLPLEVTCILSEIPPPFQYYINDDDQGFVCRYDSVIIPIKESGKINLDFKFINQDTIFYSYSLQVQPNR